MWTARAAPLAALALASLLVAGCASLSEAFSESDDDIGVHARLRVADGWQALEGVQCTMSNDRGTWTATTPGRANVKRSTAPLRVECAKEGYERASFQLECRVPGHAPGVRDPVELGLGLLSLSLGVVALPVAPHLAGNAILQGALYTGGSLGGSGPDLCTYRIVSAEMKASRTSP